MARFTARFRHDRIASSVRVLNVVERSAASIHLSRLAVPMWSTIQPKFIPKSPVITVSEQKCRRGPGIDVG
jgi:hypothetical protein